MHPREWGHAGVPQVACSLESLCATPRACTTGVHPKKHAPQVHNPKSVYPECTGSVHPREHAPRGVAHQAACTMGAQAACTPNCVQKFCKTSTPTLPSWRLTTSKPPSAWAGRVFGVRHPQKTRAGATGSPVRAVPAVPGGVPGTHPAVGAGRHRVGHPRPEAGARGADGDGVADARQLPAAWGGGQGAGLWGGGGERWASRSRNRSSAGIQGWGRGMGSCQKGELDMG